MTKTRSISIADAKALAGQWEAEYEDHQRTVAIADRFKHATPSEVIAMYESGRNERGQKLSQSEFVALVERWLGLFGAYPPSGDDVAADETAATQPEEPGPRDDDMLSPRDVVRLAGVSLRTLKRMVDDGRFPKPMHLSPRRIGWPAREVKAWLKDLDDQRYATRQ